MPEAVASRLPRGRRVLFKSRCGGRLCGVLHSDHPERGSGRDPQKAGTWSSLEGQVSYCAALFCEVRSRSSLPMLPHRCQMQRVNCGESGCGSALRWDAAERPKAHERDASLSVLTLEHTARQKEHPVLHPISFEKSQPLQSDRHELVALSLRSLRPSTSRVARLKQVEDARHSSGRECARGRQAEYLRRRDLMEATACVVGGWPVIRTRGTFVVRDLDALNEEKLKTVARSSSSLL